MYTSFCIIATQLELTQNGRLLKYSISVPMLIIIITFTAFAWFYLWAHVAENLMRANRRWNQRDESPRRTSEPKVQNNETFPGVQRTDWSAEDTQSDSPHAYHFNVGILLKIGTRGSYPRTANATQPWCLPSVFSERLLPLLRGCRLAFFCKAGRINIM